MICIKTGLDICLANAGMRADLFMLAQGAEELLFAKGNFIDNYEATSNMVLKTKIWDVIYDTYDKNHLVIIAMWAKDCLVSKRLANFLEDKDCPFEPSFFNDILK